MKFFVNRKYSLNGKIVVVQMRYNEKNEIGTIIAPKEVMHWGSVSATLKNGWLVCEGPARVLTEDEGQEFARKLLFEQVFEAADLTEIEEGALGEKLYTNAYIMEKMWHYPDTFYDCGMRLLQMADNAYDRRKWLCEQVDALWK
ncbi:MAG: hypothetical protein WAV51_02470 [Microgenomates group bacterium]